MLTPEQDRADREAKLRRVRAAAAACVFSGLDRAEILAAVEAGFVDARPPAPRETPPPARMTAKPGSAKAEMLSWLESAGA